MKLLEGMKKSQSMGEIKIMEAKEIRDAIDSLDQGNSNLSKEVDRKMCEIID